MPLISRNLMRYRPQEIGKIKLGRRGSKLKTSGGADMFQPVKLDYFEVTTMEREGKDGPFIRDEAIHKIVGDKPTELEGTLGFHEIEDNLHTSMRFYGGKRWKIKCDGEKKTLRGGAESHCDKPPDLPCPNGCKPYCRLHLQLHASPMTGGYHTFRTRGWGSTNNIQTFMEEIFARFGTCFQAPVKLMAYQSEDQFEVDGKDMMGTSTKAALVLNMPYEDSILHMVKAKERLEAMRERLMLTAGEFTKELDQRDEEDEADIAAEFSPPKELPASIRTQEGLDEVMEGLKPVEPPEPPQNDPESESEGPPDPEKEIRELVIEYRDAARSLDLLDAKGEQFIADALDQGGKPMEKALKALERKMDEYREKRKNEGA